MKHSLLLAVAITGLCCAASTPWAQIKDKMPKTKTQTQSQAIRHAVLSQASYRATPSQFLPQTIKAHGTFRQESSFSDGDFTIQSNNTVSDSTTCKAEYTDGLLSKLNSDNKYQYLIENYEGSESTKQTTNFAANGTISYFHNSKNLLDSTNYNFYYSEGSQRIQLDLYHKYGYDNNAQCISYNENALAYGRQWFENSNTYDYKAATDSTPECVTTIKNKTIRRYAVLATDSKGVPTKVNFVYGNFSSEKIDTTFEITFSDIKWTKANAPGKIFKLGFDMSPEIYNYITLQNVLQNWATDDNQLKSCSYKLTTHNRYHTNHSGTMVMDVTDAKITIAVNDSDSEFSDNITIERDSAGNINVSTSQDTNKYYAYPDNLPEYMVKFIAGVSADYMDSPRVGDFIETTAIGDRLYSPSPFTLEYDNNGALTRITYKDSTSISSSDGSITQKLNYVIECSDFNPYTGIQQPEAMEQWKAFGGNGSIAVSGVNGQQVAVYAVNGRLAYNAPVADSATISVPAGIYIVKVGPKACKVIVR